MLWLWVLCDGVDRRSSTAVVVRAVAGVVEYVVKLSSDGYHASCVIMSGMMQVYRGDHARRSRQAERLGAAPQTERAESSSSSYVF